MIIFIHTRRVKENLVSIFLFWFLKQNNPRRPIVHTVVFSLSGSSYLFFHLSRIKSGISLISSESFGRAFKTPHLCYKNSWKQLLLHRIIHFRYSYVRLANSSICYHFIDILFCTRLLCARVCVSPACVCMYRFGFVCARARMRIVYAHTHKATPPPAADSHIHTFSHIS